MPSAPVRSLIYIQSRVKRRMRLQGPALALVASAEAKHLTREKEKNRPKGQLFYGSGRACNTPHETFGKKSHKRLGYRKNTLKKSVRISLILTKRS